MFLRQFEKKKSFWTYFFFWGGGGWVGGRDRFYNLVSNFLKSSYYTMMKKVTESLLKNLWTEK